MQFEDYIIGELCLNGYYDETVQWESLIPGFQYDYTNIIILTNFSGC